MESLKKYLVRWVQDRLNVHGYKVDNDGKYGAQSEKAVRAFQLAKGLAVDGVVGRASAIPSNQ